MPGKKKGCCLQKKESSVSLSGCDSSSSYCHAVRGSLDRRVSVWAGSLYSPCSYLTSRLSVSFCFLLYLLMKSKDCLSGSLSGGDYRALFMSFLPPLRDWSLARNPVPLLSCSPASKASKHLLHYGYFRKCTIYILWFLITFQLKQIKHFFFLKFWEKLLKNISSYCRKDSVTSSSILPLLLYLEREHQLTSLWIKAAWTICCQHVCSFTFIHASPWQVSTQ